MNVAILYFQKRVKCSQIVGFESNSFSIINEWKNRRSACTILWGWYNKRTENSSSIVLFVLLWVRKWSDVPIDFYPFKTHIAPSKTSKMVCFFLVAFCYHYHHKIQRIFPYYCTSPSSDRTRPVRFIFFLVVYDVMCLSSMPAVLHHGHGHDPVAAERTRPLATSQMRVVVAGIGPWWTYYWTSNHSYYY